MMHDTGSGIIHIHLCSKNCEKKLPDAHEHLKYSCPHCHSTVYNKDGKEAAKQNFECLIGNRCERCKKRRCRLFKCLKCKEAEYCDV